MNRFKKGDKVRLITLGAIDWESCDWWCYDDGLEINCTYTVNSVKYSEHPAITILEGKYQYDVHPDHFELVESTNEVDQLRARVAALEESLKMMIGFSDTWGREWFNKQDWAAIEKAKSLLQ